ncbi:hypothetical protein CHELA1G11_12900 [Hyphomicrobiales bacterium]|nr:hypothetical protein CHELA1G2_11410 [Hyphomicrobiales bacterium]CAH1667906.1 hypothetical protein CHELA1G11_12900 [Hyphomicrobiales bacterium]
MTQNVLTAAITRFDAAAMEWGWQSDQGSKTTAIDASKQEYEDSKADLLRLANEAPRVLDPVYKAVERILDENSAWIARPNDEVTRRIALAATIAAHTLVTAERAEAETDVAPAGHQWKHHSPWDGAVVWREKQYWNGAYSRESRPLYLHPPKAAPDVEAISADAVKSASEDGQGFWRSCSGCHELNEGHPTGRYSKALLCHLGLGCHECGGIGAVWDTTDYSDFGRHLSEAPEPSFQARVQPWMMECFGAEISSDVVERCDRFIEEAIEAVQALSYPEERITALQRYVYGRPAGQINQEVGGVMVTLAALCLAVGVDMHVASETELARVWTKVDQIRAKQAAKPTGSALPQAVPPSPGPSQAPEASDPTDGEVYTGKLYGPLSYLNIPLGLTEEDWRTDTDPDDDPEVVSLPLFAAKDPMAITDAARIKPEAK